MAYMLLTGATGLLGGYLLRDALRQELPVAVVVRRSAAFSARRRIDAVLAPWERERALPRPVVLEGDLSRPGLGLCDDDLAWLGAHCRSVLHSAASISFYREEKSNEPYRTNVDGTRHLLDLCRTAGIGEFHHVSTAYVCGRRSGRVLETELDVGQQHGNDYELSKLAAEKMVLAADFSQPPTIYRPSIIVGDSQTGYTTTFHGYYTPIQVAWWLAKAGVLASGVDDWFLGQLGLQGSERKNIVPVDWVSQVILHIVQRSALHGRAYHLACENPPTATELAAAIGDVIKPRMAAGDDRAGGSSIPAELMESDFRRHMDVYRAYFRDHPEFDTTNLRMAAPHLPCPPVDRELLARTGKFALDANFGWPHTPPPTVPVDVDALLSRSLLPEGTSIRGGAGILPAINDGQASSLPHAGPARQAGPTCVVEVTGPGGGAWSVSIEPGGLTSPARRIDRGRVEHPAAAIRLRSDTLAALLERRIDVSSALHCGRMLVTGSPEHAEAAVALLHDLVEQREGEPLCEPTARTEPRPPETRPSAATALSGQEV